VVIQEKTALERRTVVREVSDLTLSAFDRWDVPAVLDALSWAELRTDLVRPLDQIGLHPPKRAMDIPEPHAKDYCALMPIHKSLRNQDFPTLKSYLKVTLCNVHDELTKRLDAPAIAAQLGRQV